MKKLICIVSVIISIFLLFCSCNDNKNNKNKRPEDVSIYSDSNTISVALDNGNYIVVDMKDGKVVTTYEVLHYLAPEDAKEMYNIMKDGLGKKYSDVKNDGYYLYLTLSEDNPDNLKGFTESQIELLYGDYIVREK